MSTSVTVLDRVVVAACSGGPSGRASEGQPVDQGERLFADVQAAAEARADSKPDNTEETDAFGSSSAANEGSVAPAGEVVAESVRKEEADAGGQEGAAVLEGAPEIVLSEIAGEVAGLGPATPLNAEVDEAKPLEGPATAEPATMAAQVPALAQSQPVEAAPAQDCDAVVETQTIAAEGVRGQADPAVVTEKVVPVEGRCPVSDTVSPDSFVDMSAKAGGEALAPSGGMPGQDVVGAAGLSTSEGPVDGVKPLDEPPLADGEAGTHRLGNVPSQEEALTVESKPGETSRPAEPQAGDPGLEAWRDVEKTAGDRRGENRGRDGADDAALFAQRTGAAASQPSDGQAGASNFSATSNEVVSPGGLMEPDSPAAPQQIAAQTLAPGNAEEAKLADATPSIREQMLDSMQVSLARGDRQLVVRLHPPELGNVVVRFQGGDDQIDATFVVSRAETRYEVEQALPEVVNGLRDSGVHLTRFEVVVGDESERDLAKEQTQQEAWSERQNSDPDANQMGRPGGPGRPAGDAGHRRHLEYAGTGLPALGQATDRIDLLM